MAEVAVLIAWMSSGVAVASLPGPNRTDRFAWAPIAAILGPLWLGITLDVTDDDRSDDALRPVPQQSTAGRTQNELVAV